MHLAYLSSHWFLVSDPAAELESKPESEPLALVEWSVVEPAPEHALRPRTSSGAATNIAISVLVVFRDAIIAFVSLGR
jgi:hypothetical protein